jgi:pyruvate kinase
LLHFPPICLALACEPPTTSMALFTRQKSVINIGVQKPQQKFTETTNIGHLAALDIDTNQSPNVLQRKTSIICTIGPVTNSVEMMVALRKAGMNIVRLNFSHGSFEYHKSVVDNVRNSYASFPGRELALALDTKGPEIRTGLNKDDKEITVTAGSELIITTNTEFSESGTAEKLFVDYKNMPRVVKVGGFIYIDDGLVSLEILEVGDDTIRTKVINTGKLGSRKGVNLPNVIVDLPAISDRDFHSLKFAVQNNMDMIFASFIRRAQDVLQIRSVLGDEGKHIRIISKIENHEGVRNFDEILAVSDGIMVARGDLGIEIPPEKVFIAQKMMISRCNIAGKPVICATQMLESMTTNPRPTRAEVSDVANAVLDGADCVMLSGETAKGKYPIEAVNMMHRICIEAEDSFFTIAHYNELKLTTTHQDIIETLAQSAVNAAIEQDVGAIICLTSSGTTARLVSKYRPRCPILTITRSAAVARACHLHRGCYPFVYDHQAKTDWQEDVDDRINYAMNEAKSMGLLASGTLVVAIQGWRSGGGHTNTMRLLTVP